jgi:hypothetical protein
MATIQDTIQEYEGMQTEMQGKLKDSFKKFTQDFFEKCPDIKTIVWVQYTPYFNDGDPCEFRVNDPTFSNCEDSDMISPWGELEEDNEDGSLWAHQGTWSVRNSDQKYLEPSVSEFCQVICSNAMEDVMLAMFGDHCRVTCTREGFTIDEYEHD